MSNTALLPFVYAFPPDATRLAISVQRPGQAGRIITETFDLGKIPPGCVTLHLLREGEHLLEPFDGLFNPPSIQRKSDVLQKEEEEKVDTDKL